MDAIPTIFVILGQLFFILMKKTLKKTIILKLNCNQNHPICFLRPSFIIIHKWNNVLKSLDKVSERRTLSSIYSETYFLDIRGCNSHPTNCEKSNINSTKCILLIPNFLIAALINPFATGLFLPRVLEKKGKIPYSV